MSDNLKNEQMEVVVDQSVPNRMFAINPDGTKTDISNFVGKRYSLKGNRVVGLFYAPDGSDYFIHVGTKDFHTVQFPVTPEALFALGMLITELSDEFLDKAQEKFAEQIDSEDDSYNPFVEVK